MVEKDDLVEILKKGRWYEDLNGRVFHVSFKRRRHMTLYYLDSDKTHKIDLDNPDKNSIDLDQGVEEIDPVAYLESLKTRVHTLESRLEKYSH